VATLVLGYHLAGPLQGAELTDDAARKKPCGRRPTAEQYSAAEQIPDIYAGHLRSRTALMDLGRYGDAISISRPPPDCPAPPPRLRGAAEAKRRQSGGSRSPLRSGEHGAAPR
jgi:hypothetical protein